MNVRLRGLVLAPALVLGVTVFINGCGSSTGGNSTQQQPSVTVSGASQVRLGSTATFSATVTNLTNTAVTWQVNGVAGGNSTVGKITAAGVYTPPSTIPTNNTVNVTAVSVASPSVSGTAPVSILNPIPSITGAEASPVSGTSYTLEVDGSSFVNGAQIQAGGANVATTFVSATELEATVTIPSGTNTLSVSVSNPNPGAMASNATNASVYVTTVPTAARLLDQATFGPSLVTIRQVQSAGVDAWITQQFNTPDTPLANIPTPLPAVCLSANTPTNCEESEWWQTVLTGPDQLRQRVAFALSEIFVISSDSDNATTITYYHNTLAQDAFTNFSTIMHDVTVSPGMGAYLNMLDSAKAPAGQIANENYARELMQLFTIGLNLLNDDGTLQLDTHGNPIPAYTQDQVQAFAKAYTGWTYATSTGGVPTKFPNTTANYLAPMVAVESAHDMTSKTLLNGTVLASGQTAEQDLQGALTNIFNHPNVGPFVCKQLIQHLVTSTPSPAYVARISAVFANNGSGVRGDMQAVIRAILEDQEARAGDTDPTYEGGHLREPMLWMTNFLRAVGFTNTDANSSYFSLSNYSNNLSQRPYRSGSVFNFFPPSYVIPGTKLNAPEFDLENTASAILRLSLADSQVNNKITSFNIDLTATGPLGQLAAAGPGQMVDMLGTIFMHGQMPTDMRTEILSAINGLGTAQQVRVATFLVITSSQYKVMH
ncbi:MAG: DUF1800 family protein [Terracidiphilus sp.]|nr:DUF1800 family protein [Terracidiphilus sp.]MDR3798864.1 DUF1800 family protein [Terracidiphilus sp.]